MVDLEADEFGTIEVFLDNICTALRSLDGDLTGDCGAQAAPILALDILGRLLLPIGTETLPR